MASLRMFLDLATCHLPEDVFQNLGDVKGVTAHGTAYGWLMWVPPNPDEHAQDYPAIPGEVLVIQRYARSHGCDYVLLDNSADTDPLLPAWDW